MTVKIDSHAHILPETWPSLKEKYGYGGFIELDHHRPGFARMMRDDGTFFREIESNCWNPDDIIRDMDKHRVNAMVLCTVPVLFNYWADANDALDWSIFLNDHLADVVHTHPKRFIGLGTAPMQDVDLAIAEMQRCKELGLPGLQIGSNINGRNLDDKALHPFWQAAQDLQMSIFVHPWEMLGSDRTSRYFLQWLVGMPAETTLAMASMIFGGVFDAFPKLKVMFAHAGGQFPFTVGRISHGYHARPDLCNVNNVGDPYEYVGKFWVDSITHDSNALDFLVKTIGESRICYGTDYPFPLGDLEHGTIIEHSSTLSTQAKANLLSSNILEFLGLERQQFVRE